MTRQHHRHRHRPRPLQLLEINLISAQDLAPVTRSMRTYAVAWVHPHRKLSTRVDTTGNTNPTWNDKFVFRVDDEFLKADTSAVMIDIYAQHWFRDCHVGTVRILVGNLLPPPARSGQRTGAGPSPGPGATSHMGMRFMALQVRRSSGRPQGILNIGVALLDSSMRSMPLYSQLSASAVGFHDLVGGGDPKKKGGNLRSAATNTSSNNSGAQTPPFDKIMLQRSKSDRSERLVSEADFSDYPATSTIGSEVSGTKKKTKTLGKTTSVLAGSEVGLGARSKSKSKSSKASSVVGGSDLFDVLKKKTGGGKTASTVSGSELGYPAMKFKGSSLLSTSSSDLEGYPAVKKTNRRASSLLSSSGSEGGEPAKGKHGNKFFEFGFKPPPKPPGSELWGGGKGGGRGGMKNFTTGSMLSVGPSPSEVAAAIAHESIFRRSEEGNDSLLDGWSLEGSEEGLRSKLERWRTELPPLYDRATNLSYRTASGHIRRRTEGEGGDGGGLFTCFGTICGVECSIACGGGPPPSSSSTARKKKSSTVRPHRSPSFDSASS